MRLLIFLTGAGVFLSLLFFFIGAFYVTNKFVIRILSWNRILSSVIITGYMLIIPYIYFSLAFVGTSMYIAFPFQAVIFYIGSITLVISVMIVTVDFESDYYINYLVGNHVFLMIGGILMLIFPTGWSEILAIQFSNAALSYGLFQTIVNGAALCIIALMLLSMGKLEGQLKKLEAWFNKVEEVENK